MTTFCESWCLLAQEGGGAGGINSLLPLAPWILIGVLFYMMLVRPERRKRAELDTMLKNLKKNDRVVTIGGIFGTIVQASADSDEVMLKVDENTNTRLRILRSSISRVLTTDGAAESKGA